MEISNCVREGFKLNWQVDGQQHKENGIIEEEILHIRWEQVVRIRNTKTDLEHMHVCALMKCGE